MRLRSCLAFASLLGFAISVVTLVGLKGGKSMSMEHDDAEAGIALPSADTRRCGTFDTATFALG
jgi:hypothetical protein